MLEFSTSTHTTSEFTQHVDRAALLGNAHAVRVAALIYLILAVLAVLAAISIWIVACVASAMWPARSQEGRIGDYAFRSAMSCPNCRAWRACFDKLVLDLKRLSQQIRQSAEDNAHSFKTPLAAIQSSLSPVASRRAGGGVGDRGACALDIIDSSLGRLLALVKAAQHLDSSAADLVEAPRIRGSTSRRSSARPLSISAKSWQAATSA